MPRYTFAPGQSTGVVRQELQQVFEKVPHCFVLCEVVSQDASGFVAVTVSEPFCNQVLDQNCNCRIDADESALMTPVNRIEMRVYLV
jgi:hypothetical protein